ncbi:MAG: biotin--[acetyl-CoA-carboxylase] ligase, partial [Alphaproteobacteria bacterium]
MGARRHGGADDVLYPDARPGCRRRRGGGEVAVPAMTNGMPALPEGFRLHRYETIGSTNDEARRLAREGAAEGTLVWADAQEAGRGRRGRPWLSPLGNLYLSLVLRPDAPASRAPQLGFVTALALADALRLLAGTGLALSFKWPNDVLAGRAKLAGILLESEMAAGGGLDFVIVGVGVNLASAPRDLEYPAASLSDQGFPGITPASLLESFTEHFALWLECWRADGFVPVRAAWLNRAGGIGEAVRVRLETLTLEGRFLD